LPEAEQTFLDQEDNEFDFFFEAKHLYFNGSRIIFLNQGYDFLLIKEGLLHIQEKP
jgi:hypothetical protein